MSAKSLGQVAFEDFHTPMNLNALGWGNISDKAQSWWESAAAAVVAAHESALTAENARLREALEKISATADDERGNAWELKEIADAAKGE